MKKLLSLLSVLTISGTAVPTTIAAIPYQKQETIKNIDVNYQQKNNLENLKRVKRQNYKNAINWTINNGIIKSIIVGNNNKFIENNVIVLKDIFYIFVQSNNDNKNRIYKYNIKTGKEDEIIVQDLGAVISSVVILNDKIYFTDFAGKIHEYNPINGEVTFLSTTEKVLYNGISFNNKLYFNSLDGKIYEYDPNTKKDNFISDFTNDKQYRISPPIILNNKIYYFLDNGSVFYYDLNTKTVYKKSYYDNRTNYNFNKPILFKNNLIVIATTLSYSDEYKKSEIFYKDTFNNINKASKITNVNNQELIVSNFLINKNELYLITKSGNIYKNSYTDSFGDLVLLENLNDSVDCAAIFDDKIYFSSNDKLYEFNLETKEKKVIVNLSSSPKKYNKINFINVLDNRLYFGDNNGKVYEYLPIKYMIDDYELLSGWKSDLELWKYGLKLGSENKQKWTENKINEFNNKFLIFRNSIQTIINLEKINTLENRINDVCNKIKEISISLNKDNIPFIISSIASISSLIPVIGSALSAILSIASSAI